MEEETEEHDIVPDHNRSELGGRRQGSPTRLLGAPSPRTRRRPLYATRVYFGTLGPSAPALGSHNSLSPATLPLPLLPYI